MNRSVLLLSLVLALAACKPKDHAAAATPSATPSPPAAPPPVATTAAPVRAANGFDPASVPVTTAGLPPFPYLAMPKGVTPGYSASDTQDFDAVQLIAGKALREVRGKVNVQSFNNDGPKLTALAARMNYENAIKALGGVKVNQVEPDDPGLAGSAQGGQLRKLLRIPEVPMSYDTWLIRTPHENIWLVVMANQNMTQTITVQEKAMEQKVGYVTADAMQKELADKGHVALYINFDTDKASIRADGKPAVDEIVTLLKNDPALKLTIEGHTDNSGNAAHNRELSQRRADAVMAVLLAAGIGRDRLTAVGLGDSKPIADNKDETGRAQNRRVELVKRT